jgi:hypothetical protein
VAYLNTSLCLLPNYSTDQERALHVVSGFHSLHQYASYFWIDHLLACLAVLDERQKKVPNELLLQLNAISRFQKEPDPLNISTNADPISGLHLLDNVPHVKGLVSSFVAFRAKSRQEDTLNVSNATHEGRTQPRHY